jgi:hypothetical protein
VNGHARETHHYTRSIWNGQHSYWPSPTWDSLVVIIANTAGRHNLAHHVYTPTLNTDLWAFLPEGDSIQPTLGDWLISAQYITQLDQFAPRHTVPLSRSSKRALHKCTFVSTGTYNAPNSPYPVHELPQAPLLYNYRDITCTDGSKPTSTTNSDRAGLGCAVFIPSTHTSMCHDDAITH